MAYSILLTGSAGAIGSRIVPALQARGHRVRGFDLGTTALLEDQVQADLTDRQAINRAMQGIDTVIHLAANPHNTPDFHTTLVPPNVIGLHHICDAARLAKVRRLVIASSVQVYGNTKLGVVYDADSPRPVTNHYALTKCFAEDMAAMLHRVHKLSTLVIRIGWFIRNREEAQVANQSEVAQHHYLSHRDAGRFFTACVEAEPVTFAVLNAVSKPPRLTLFEMASAQQVIGFEALDVYPQGIEQWL